MQDVRKERYKYIGGSDMPIILGILEWDGYDANTGEKVKKNRWGLLQEKAGIIDLISPENKYMDYGNTMEPKIRDFLNSKKKKPYLEDEVFELAEVLCPLRYHSDGFDGKEVLEIKTTKAPNGTVDSKKLKAYEAQLLVGMIVHDVKKGLLAIYDRPDDFSEEFEEERLLLKTYKRADLKELEEEIKEEIAKFRADLRKVIDNPLMTEADLRPADLQNALERLIAVREEKQRLDELEKAVTEEVIFLFKHYEESSGKTNAGDKITYIPASVYKRKKFDDKRFKEEHGELYSQYVHEEETERKESLRVTRA